MLRSMPLCNDLEPSELEAFASVLTPRSFAPGDTLFREGRHGTCCYLQVAGRVGIYRRLADGSDVRLAQTRPGGIIGELALLDDGPRTATAIAEITSVSTLQLLRSDFERLIQARSRFAYVLLDGLMRDLARRLRRTTARLATVHADPSRDPTGARLQHAAEAAAAHVSTHTNGADGLPLDLAGIAATPCP